MTGPIALILSISLFSSLLSSPARAEWVIPTSYRITVIVDRGSSSRKNSPAGVALDFAKIFQSNGIPGRLDLDSIRVVRFDSQTGQAVPYRPKEFGYEIPYRLTGDFANDDAGRVWWRMADNSATHFHIYFDSLANGKVEGPKVIGTVGVGDGFYYNDGQPRPSVAGNVDWDGDGLPDRVESGRRNWEYGRAMDEKLGNVINFFKNVGTAERHLFTRPIMLKSDEGTYLLDKGYLNVNVSPIDWDDDGDPDFLGFRGDQLLVMENTGKRDRNNLWILKQPRIVTELETSEFRDSVPGVVDKPALYLARMSFADWEGDGDLDMLVTVGNYQITDKFDPKRGVIPFAPFLAYFELFENIGTDEKKDWKFKKPRVILEERGLPITTNTGGPPAYVDWDGDGDFDLLLTDDGERPWDGLRMMWSENVGTRDKPLFLMPIHPIPPANWSRLYPENLLDADFIFRDLNRLNRRWGFPLSNSAQELYPMPGSYSATWVDWNGDGILDLVTGTHAVMFYRNIGTLLDPVFDTGIRLEEDGIPILMPNWLDPQAEEPSHWGPQGAGEASVPIMEPTVRDWDGDGDLDLFVTAQRWQVKYFENIGTRTKPKLTRGRELRVNGDPFEFSWRNKVAIGDLDGDGESELVTTSDRDNVFYQYKRIGQSVGVGVLELKRSSPLVLEDGNHLKGSYIDANNNGDNHAVLADWDADGDLDLINSGLYHAWYYENTGSIKQPKFKAHGRFKAGGEVIQTYNHAGACDVADWNDDGRLDLIMGSESANALHLFDRSFIENDLPIAKAGPVETR